MRAARRNAREALRRWCVARVRPRFALRLDDFVERVARLHGLDDGDAVSEAAEPGHAASDRPSLRDRDVEGAARRLRLDDLYLVSACADGEAAAWEELDRRFFPLVRRFARAFGLGDEVASAVAEEVIDDLRRKPSIERYQGRSSLETWLAALVTHAALGARARRAREASGPADEEHHADSSSSSQAPRHAEQPLAEAVVTALRSLPPRERLPILLHHERRLTLAEIGALDGLPAQTVGRAVQRIGSLLQGRIERSLQERCGPNWRELLQEVDLARLDVDPFPEQVEHLEPNVVAGYLDRTLDRPTSEEAAAHLADCRDCRIVLAAQIRAARAATDFESTVKDTAAQPRAVRAAESAAEPTAAPDVADVERPPAAPHVPAPEHVSATVIGHPDDPALEPGHAVKSDFPTSGGSEDADARRRARSTPREGVTGRRALATAVETAVVPPRREGPPSAAAGSRWPRLVGFAAAAVGILLLLALWRVAVGRREEATELATLSGQQSIAFPTSGAGDEARGADAASPSEEEAGLPTAAAEEGEASGAETGAAEAGDEPETTPEADVDGEPADEVEAPPDEAEEGTDRETPNGDEGLRDQTTDADEREDAGETAGDVQRDAAGDAAGEPDTSGAREGTDEAADLAAAGTVDDADAEPPSGPWKRVGKKTFRLRNDTWTDDAYREAVSPPPRNLARGSPEFRAMLDIDPWLGRYSEMAQRVVVVIEGVPYRIVSLELE